MVSVRALLVGTVVLALLAPTGVAGYAANDGYAPGGADRTMDDGSPGTMDDGSPGTMDDGSPGGSAVGSSMHFSRAREPATDNTITRISVRTDGDARWTVTIRTRLETDEAVEEYRTFQERFRENRSRFIDPFAERMGAIVAESSNETGREMVARNFTASTSVQEVPRRWGVVSFAFTWTNFAATEGDALVVGDVFEGGFFLAENDSLIVEAPSGYAVRSSDPGPVEADQRAVTWLGREDFADRRPRVEFVPVEPASPTATDQGGSGASDRLLLGVAMGALVLTGLAAVVARRRHLWRLPLLGAGGDDDDGAPAAVEDVGNATGGDVPVVTDAEKVEALLAKNGGRMKQAAVEDSLEWSASKTSRVVADMVEEGRVEKLRVGRENVLDLPD